MKKAIAQVRMWAFFGAFGLLMGCVHPSSQPVKSEVGQPLPVKVVVVTMFERGADEGDLLATFTMYEDYRLVASGAGSGIDFAGELILVGDNLYAIDPAEFRDRVVVIESMVSVEEKADYALAGGARGAFFVPDRYWLVRNGEELGKTLGTEGRREPRLGMPSTAGR